MNAALEHDDTVMLLSLNIEEVAHFVVALTTVSGECTKCGEILDRLTALHANMRTTLRKTP